MVGEITSVDSRSDKRSQPGEVCSNPQLFFLEVFGSLEPALTNFMYENLVLENWYDVKKIFIDDTRNHNTASWRKVNLPCCNATLHAPRMWAKEQTCFEPRKHTASRAISHQVQVGQWWECDICST